MSQCDVHLGDIVYHVSLYVEVWCGEQVLLYHDIMLRYIVTGFQYFKLSRDANEAYFQKLKSNST